MVWQDQNDFTLKVPINLQNDRAYGKKIDIPDSAALRCVSFSKKILKESICVIVIRFSVTFANQTFLKLI